MTSHAEARGRRRIDVVSAGQPHGRVRVVAVAAPLRDRAVGVADALGASVG